jgi:hypothetical protein
MGLIRRLKFNTVKLVLNFHSSQQRYVDKQNVMYKNIVTVYSPNINFFAIALTENLKWHAHIDILCKCLKRHNR